MRPARPITALTSAALLLLALGAAWGQIIGGAPGPLPIITGTLLQGHQDSGAGAALTVTLPGASGQVIRLYNLVAVCSAGNSSFTITSPLGTVIFDLHNSSITTSPFITDFDPGLTGAIGQDMVLALGGCGGAAIAHLTWMAGRR